VYPHDNFTGYVQQKNRPFYQSTKTYPFRLPPYKEIVSFLCEDFNSIGKRCPPYLAKKISEKVSQFRTRITLLKFLIMKHVLKNLLIDYMMHQRPPSGWIQYVRNKLVKFDLIEKHDNVWKIVDPVFGRWLEEY